MDAPLAVTIAEAVRLTGLGRTTIYQAVSRGELVVRKYGGRSLILRHDLIDWLENLPAAKSSRRGTATPVDSGETQ
jgi:excisionase family DNA binding protein